MPANLENSTMAMGVEKVFIPVPKEDSANNIHYWTIELISHASKLMLKYFKLGFNSTWTKKFQMQMLDLEKAEE